jgi:hypothetical protein
MALIREGGHVGGRADEQALSLANACNTLVQAHPPWAQDNTSRGSSPPCVPSRADPSGLGHAATIYSSVQGPPGVETPTTSKLGPSFPCLRPTPRLLRVFWCENRLQRLPPYLTPYKGDKKLLHI